MKRMKKAILITLAVLCVGALLAGCGKSGVSTEGSTSMSNVIEITAEAYKAETGITVTYNPTGSGSGIQAVLEGRCDIGLSSRNLKSEEKSKGLCETVLAYDGICVIVNPENPVSDMDLETVLKMFTGKIRDWSEIGAGSGSVVLVGREAGSGTREGFESATGTVGKCMYRQELTSTGDVITTVAGNPSAIGYASVASVKNTVKVLKIGGVLPNSETIASGDYVIRRPFVLVTPENGEMSEEAKKFFDYITSEKAAPYIEKCGVVFAHRKLSD